MDRRYFKVSLVEKIDKRKKGSDSKEPLRVIGLLASTNKETASDKCALQYPSYTVESVEEFTEEIEEKKQRGKKA